MQLQKKYFHRSTINNLNVLIWYNDSNMLIWCNGEMVLWFFVEILKGWNGEMLLHHHGLNIFIWYNCVMAQWCFDGILIDRAMVKWCYMVVKNNMMSLIVSWVISPYWVSLGLIQYANVCDTENNGPAQLCYLRMEGIMMVSLNFIIFTFTPR